MTSNSEVKRDFSYMKIHEQEKSIEFEASIMTSTSLRGEKR